MRGVKTSMPVHLNRDERQNMSTPAHNIARPVQMDIIAAIRRQTSAASYGDKKTIRSNASELKLSNSRSLTA